TVGFLAKARAKDSAALKDAARLGVLAASLTAARERRPSLRSVSVWTASGAIRHSPWVPIDEAGPKVRELLEGYVFNERAHFPAAPPATGDVAVWVPATAGPRLLPEGRFVAAFVPARDRAGPPPAGGR